MTDKELENERTEKRGQIWEACGRENVSLEDIEDILGDDDIFAIM